MKGGGAARPNSAVAKSDYIMRTGEYTDVGNSHRDKVVLIESGNIPDWARGWEGAHSERRSAGAHGYWTFVDGNERSNGQLFREIEVALPRGLCFDQQVQLVRDFARDLTDVPGVGGMPYSFAIHEGRSKKPGELSKNPHAHILVSERINDCVQRSPEQFFKQGYRAGKDPASGGARKNRAWNRRDITSKIRSKWEQFANAALEAAGLNPSLDCRSYAAQELNIEPTKHEGRGPCAAEIHAENAQIVARNDERKSVDADIAAAERLRARLLADMSAASDEMPACLVARNGDTDVQVEAISNDGRAGYMQSDDDMGTTAIANKPTRHKLVEGRDRQDSQPMPTAPAPAPGAGPTELPPADSGGLAAEVQVGSKPSICAEDSYFQLASKPVQAAPFGSLAPLEPEWPVPQEANWHSAVLREKNPTSAVATTAASPVPAATTPVDSVAQPATPPVLSAKERVEAERAQFKTAISKMDKQQIDDLLMLAKKTEIEAVRDLTIMQMRGRAPAAADVERAKQQLNQIKRKAHSAQIASAAADAALAAVQKNLSVLRRLLGVPPAGQAEAQTRANDARAAYVKEYEAYLACLKKSQSKVSFEDEKSRMLELQSEIDRVKFARQAARERLVEIAAQAERQRIAQYASETEEPEAGNEWEQYWRSTRRTPR